MFEPACPGGARPRIVVIGAGAGGTLTALHLARSARRRTTPVDLVLLDPTDRWARGVAFGTPDEDHLLNVPASGMTAFPEEPGHFVSWLAREQQGMGDPNAFVPRRWFARYLDDVLTQELAAADDLVTVQHRRLLATGIVRDGEGWAVVGKDGSRIAADAVVVATGLPEVGARWAPATLRDSAFFVPDPWAPGALDVIRRDRTGPSDVLIVGTGLTMVDVVLSSRAPATAPIAGSLPSPCSGRLPRRHLVEPKLAVIPDIADWPHDLDGLVERATRHLRDVRTSTGDWRPAVDGLRFRVAELWSRLDDEGRAAFLTRVAAEWERSATGCHRPARC
ncbi:FAD/NAD(P)-binding protein [Nocardioides alcanivorans]|uniref:FAD/NAD(P)-binding protein n=1 Tax=Nocardioides alcanivorans TaxID=2897352 RepID=UPI001F253F9D|nr:FAD/NAD(P)-binding protein [Nocardioides alcanivorans]